MPKVVDRSQMKLIGVYEYVYNLALENNMFYDVNGDRHTLLSIDLGLSTHRKFDNAKTH